MSLHTHKDLTLHERRALHALRGRSAVLLDRKWRARGAPAPVLNDFAVATLLGQRLVYLHTPRSMMLTQEGQRIADKVSDDLLPPWLARA